VSTKTTHYLLNAKMFTQYTEGKYAEAYSQWYLVVRLVRLVGLIGLELSLAVTSRVSRVSAMSTVKVSNK